MISRRKWLVGCGALTVTSVSVLALLALLAWTVLLGGDAGDYFDSAGVRIHYTDAGQGTPVLLVHGFAGNANLEWGRSGVTEALREDYRVITLDHRGHGRSGKPHGPDNYGLHMVEDLVRLLDYLDIEKAHVVGYSMGGFITLKLAITHPERLLSAAPCGSGWEELTEENMAFGEAVAQALETDGGIGPLAVRLGMEERPPRRLERLGVRMATGLFNDRYALAAVMRGFHEFAVTEAELQANRVPTLTLIGSRDGLLPGAEALAERMANHELILIEGKNHFNAPGAEDFLRALRAFLAAHERE